MKSTNAPAGILKTPERNALASAQDLRVATCSSKVNIEISPGRVPQTNAPRPNASANGNGHAVRSEV